MRTPRYYVIAASPLDRVRVLKQGDTFAVFDRAGDMAEASHGLFVGGTRFVSTLRLGLEQTRPMLLSSSILSDDILFAAHLTNPDILAGPNMKISRGTLHFFRSRLVLDGACFERLQVSNYGEQTVEFDLSLAVDGDFADIFEVRGIRRGRRGRRSSARVRGSTLQLDYRGLDGVSRRLQVDWKSPRTWRAKRDHGTLVWRVRMRPHTESCFKLRSRCSIGRRAPPDLSFERALERAFHERAELSPGECRVDSSNQQFNAWLSRSYADIHMMTNRMKEGFFPFAGVPWFNAVFGRDGIWTALFYLWIAPSLAKGVLAFLAARQAQTTDAVRDAEPGKILHEMRGGEMASLGEIPFGLYYGSVDSTPLFVMLAGAYLERTGDLPFAWTIWPAVERAMSWLEHCGDFDHDGFIEYERRSKDGLSNQGWKDSHDSVFHQDGSLARGSIALCEVQGYAFAAMRRAARMAVRLGKPGRAREYAAKAAALRERFEKTFWSDELGLYAMALDGQKRPCLARASNAGHLLYCGIAGRERARRLARTLLGPEFYSGWGIRTVAAGESRYNPMSYHDGSVWPHDNAIIAQGMADYGFKSMALLILQGLFEASQFMDLNRLPELFCGFDRRPGEGPTLYPVACSPQSWSSAAPFLLLQAVLGLRIDGDRRSVVFDHPVLPSILSELRIRGLSVGGGSADVLLTRQKPDVGVHVMHRSGPIEVLMVK